MRTKNTPPTTTQTVVPTATLFPAPTDCLTGKRLQASVSVTSQSLTDGWPLLTFATTVEIVTPRLGTREHHCVLTWDKRRVPSPFCISWDFGGLPAPYRRAVQRLVCDLADGLIGAEGTKPQTGTTNTTETVTETTKAGEVPA